MTDEETLEEIRDIVRGFLVNAGLAFEDEEVSNRELVDSVRELIG